MPPRERRSASVARTFGGHNYEAGAASRSADGDSLPAPFPLGRFRATVHRVSDLRFALLENTSTLGTVRVLASREARWNADFVCFHVLAVSHAVVIRRERPLTELLTCGDYSPGVQPLARVQITAPYELSTRVGCIAYRCRLEPFSLVLGDDLIGGFSPEQRMDVFFPGDDVKAPVTRIGWRIEPAYLTVETVHSYPEENVGVRSQSRFELRDGGS
jgi:hypothetical protein